MFCCGPHGQRQAAQMATERTQCGVGRRRATLVQLVMREIWRRGLHSMLAFDAVVALPCFQTDGSAGDADKRQPDQSPVLVLTGPAWG